MIKQISIVLFKELKCLFRDKKTFLVGLLIPLLLLPCILLISDFATKKTQNQIVSNVKVGINNKDNCFFNFLSAQSGVTLVDVNDVEKDLSSGKINSYIIVDDDLNEKILKNQDFNIDLYKSDDTSLNSITTLSVKNIVELYIYSFKSEIVPYVLKENFAENSEDLNSLMQTLDITNEVQGNISENTSDIDMSSIYFNMLVPMMLVMYCCMGSSSTANELSAGEKERGTLESLLSTGADRNAIIIGKLLATTVIGCLSGICTTIGLWGYLMIYSNNYLKLSLGETITLLIITLLTSMFFAAVNLTIGVYSKSNKEAQTYFTPVYLIVTLPTFFTLNMDIGNINLIHLSVPILNITCVIKEVLGGAINLLHLTIVSLWLLIYVGIAFFIMQKLFKKEEVLFRL